MTIFKYDASKLLYARSENDRLIHQLEIEDDERATLLETRKKARSAIRKAFNDSKAILEEDFKKQSRLRDVQVAFREITPAFWPQGSFSYGTLNNPAFSPPQQLDIDDGVYLPMELFDDNPIYSKGVFFQIVDTALKQLVAENQGWEFDGSKPTCARIVISPRIHLDFPLYAVPRERFEELKKSTASLTATFDYALEESIKLDPEEVYLARRDKEHWIKSDPKKIKLWFDCEKEVHGDRLVRVCRYLKAWRDFNWEKGGPTSITLMACAASVFDDSNGFNRDCEALFAVAEQLPVLFAGVIKNPAELEETLYPRELTQEVIDDIVNKAEIFRDTLTKALIHAETPQEVVDLFIRSLGRRIPNNNTYITPISSVSVALNTPIRKQSAPIVKNLKSG
jgi:hypothetical protein